MSDLEHYCQKWSLEYLEKIAETHSSFVYKVRMQDGRLAVLKILNEQGREYECRGADMLRWYDGQGAVRLYESDAGASLMWYAGSGEIGNYSLKKCHPSETLAGRDERVTHVICYIVKELHKKRKSKPPELVDLKTHFQDLYVEREISDDPLIHQAAEMADYLLETTEQNIPLHGDIHHHNIVRGQRKCLAIDPQGLFGDPCYDFANLYGNPHGFEKESLCTDRVNMIADIVSERMGYDRQRLLQFGFVHNVIASIWKGGHNQEHKYAVAKVIKEQL